MHFTICNYDTCMCYRVLPTHKNEKQKTKTQKDEHAYHTRARKHTCMYCHVNV